MPLAAAAQRDRLIGRVVEASVCVLLVMEVATLFAGVLARYAFHVPLVWSDEFASVLFLWLGMLGTVIALRKGEHMAMTAVVSAASGRVHRILQEIARFTTLAVLILLLKPAIDYVQDDAIVTLSALDVSQTWRTAALPVGFALMVASILLRAAEQANRATVIGLAVVAAACAAMVWMPPVLLSLGRINLLIFFLGVVPLLVFAGVGIAVAFSTATLGYLVLSTRLPLTVLVGRIDSGMGHYVLLSVPLFVLLGLLIELTGMARVMVAFLASLVGHFRGGLHYVLVAAMYLVSGISGSKAADMAAIAPVLFPEMERRGADRGELVALLAATGAQTETVPPSLVLITVGSVTGVSIAALFTGGLLPGFLLGAMLCGAVAYRARRQEVAIVRAPASAIAKAFVVAVPALLLPILIRLCVVEGVATATEVSTVGVVYVCVVGSLVYRRFDVARIVPMLIKTASLSGAILFIVASATAMAWAVTQSGFSGQLARSISNLPGGHWSFLGVSIVLFAVLGSVLEGIPAIVLFGPLLFPIAKQLGINEVHYAMVAILSMGVGLFAPPFGVGYYVASAVSGCSPERGMRHIWGYLVILIAGLLVVAAIPSISTGFL